MNKILYVDDDAELLEIGKIFLEMEDVFSVDTVLSARTALTLLESKTYDAIISDYEMPGMDGIIFLKTVRGTGSKIPFILFTGKGREEVVIEALNEGADYYLQKGGDPQAQFVELTHKIRQAVEKRKSDAWIRDHERLEQDIINFLPDATFAINKEGKVIAWNRAIEDMTSISADVLVGKGNLEHALSFYGVRRPMLVDLLLNNRDDLEGFYDWLNRDEGTLAAETTLLREGGRKQVFWGKASLLYDQHGAVIGAIESIRDISDRKHDEEALKESEAKYRRFVETANDGIWQMDGHFNTVYVNTRMAEILGYSTKEMIGRNILDFIPEDDRPAMSACFQKRIDGKRERYERRILTNDGNIHWLLVSATPIIDPDGTFLGSFAMCSDITERKKFELDLTRRNQDLQEAYEKITATEEELRQNYQEMEKSQKLLQESENRFRMQYESNPMAILTLQKQGEEFILIGCNAAAIHFSKGRVRKLIGITASRLLASRPALLSALWTCYREKSVTSGVIRSHEFLPGNYLHTTIVHIPPDLILVYNQILPEGNPHCQIFGESDDTLDDSKSQVHEGR